MVQAYILIQTEVGKAAIVAEQVRQIEGVETADDVTGPYDVIVKASSNDVDTLTNKWSPDPDGRGHHPHAHLPGGEPLGSPWHYDFEAIAPALRRAVITTAVRR